MHRQSGAITRLSLAATNLVQNNNCVVKCKRQLGRTGGRRHRGRARVDGGIVVVGDRVEGRVVADPGVIIAGEGWRLVALGV